MNLGAVVPAPCGQIVLASYNVPQTFSQMSIEAALVDYLTSKVSIPGGLWPNAVARANTVWPAVTYSRASTEHEQGISGGLGVATAHFELDVWSPIYGDVVTTAHAIRIVMEGFQGWWDCKGILSVFLESESDSVEDPKDGSGTWWYSRSLDYAVMFAESVPRF